MDNPGNQNKEISGMDTAVHDALIKTPAAIRALGGALFCDRRYNHVFVYHNSAESYYATRGFRGLLKV